MDTITKKLKQYEKYEKYFSVMRNREIDYLFEKCLTSDNPEVSLIQKDIIASIELELKNIRAIQESLKLQLKIFPEKKKGSKKKGRKVSRDLYWSLEHEINDRKAETEE